MIPIVHNPFTAAHCDVLDTPRTLDTYGCLLPDVQTSSAGQAMILFFSGFATGTLLTICLFLGADRSQRLAPKDSVAENADRWKYQRPLPPH
jgi:hypothetical protein